MADLVKLVRILYVGPNLYNVAEWGVEVVNLDRVERILPRTYSVRHPGMTAHDVQCLEIYFVGQKPDADPRRYLGSLGMVLRPNLETRS